MPSPAISTLHERSCRCSLIRPAMSAWSSTRRMLRDIALRLLPGRLAACCCSGPEYRRESGTQDRFAALLPYFGKGDSSRALAPPCEPVVTHPPRMVTRMVASTILAQVFMMIAPCMVAFLASPVGPCRSPRAQPVLKRDVDTVSHEHRFCVSRHRLYSFERGVSNG